MSQRARGCATDRDERSKDVDCTASDAAPQLGLNCLEGCRDGARAPTAAFGHVRGCPELCPLLSLAMHTYGPYCSIVLITAATAHSPLFDLGTPALRASQLPLPMDCLTYWLVRIVVKQLRRTVHQAQVGTGPCMCKA